MPPVALHHALDGPRDAPVLVLGSSLGTTLEMWDPLVPALAQRLRVLRYDHRGHGRSPAPPGPYEIADLGGDVLALLDALRIERAHVAGVSLGGMLALWIAAHAPERVNRLVTMCTAARLGPPEVWRERAATVRAQGMEAIADAVVGRWFTPRADPAVVASARAMLVACRPEAYAACCGAIERMDLEPDLAAIRAPTLLIAASEDQATPPEHAVRIAAAVPQARIAVVAEAAHLANRERPATVAALMLEHLG
jgi:3-oxoadipate enol-lactonase